MRQLVSDATLVGQTLDGRVDAFDELVERHSAMVYRVGLRMLGNHCDAQDLAQESMLAAWQHLSSFRAESTFSTWLYRIVTRRALNRLTRGHTERCLELCPEFATPTPGPQDRTERHATADAVTAAVMTLPPAQRVVIVLHHFEGLTYDQAAAVTGTSAASVRSHLYRARRTLINTLAEFAPAPA